MKNSLSLKSFIALASLVAATTVATGSAMAKSGTNVGVLDCTIAAGVGLILGSSKEVSCAFTPSKGQTQNYGGSITKLGLDIGVTGESFVKWVVFAPGSVDRGALAGDYGGGSAEATIGLGLGANVLVGGLKESIALQPVSVQGQTGLNLAVGIAGLKLKYKE
jgi:hypothetical protein